MNLAQRKTVLRAAGLCAAALIILLAGVRLMERGRQTDGPSGPGDGTAKLMASGQVAWEGEEYRKIPRVTLLLIAGIDQAAQEQQGVGSSRYRNGGQADFLMLVALDHTNRRICRLQIDRDTMAEVTVLSVYGQVTGERMMQICLSHSFGANREENAQYTLRAVRKLLKNADIDGYYMIDYTAVAELSDALGGIRVTVPDDMTSVNPLWEKGAEVTLRGEEAEWFVRSRKTVGEGTNRERMQRQNVFMQGVIGQIQKTAAEDSSFALRLLSSLKAKAATNLSEQQLAAEMQSAAAYEVLPVEYLDGEYRIGENGYAEFVMRDGSAESWIMQNLYTKK